MQFEIFFSFYSDKQKDALLKMLSQYANRYHIYEYDSEISAYVNELGVKDSSYSGYIDIDNYDAGLPRYNYLTPEQAEIYLTMFYPSSAWVKGIFHGFEYECKAYTVDRDAK